MLAMQNTLLRSAREAQALLMRKLRRALSLQFGSSLQDDLDKLLCRRTATVPLPCLPALAHAHLLLQRFEGTVGAPRNNAKGDIDVGEEDEVAHSTLLVLAAHAAEATITARTLEEAGLADALLAAEAFSVPGVARVFPRAARKTKIHAEALLRRMLMEGCGSGGDGDNVIGKEVTVALHRARASGLGHLNPAFVVGVLQAAGATVPAARG